MYFLRYMALVACVARAGPTIAARLTADIIELAQQYGRYGYRKVAGLLRQAGWIINDKRGERIWRREGLKVPPKQPDQPPLSGPGGMLVQSWPFRQRGRRSPSA